MGEKHIYAEDETSRLAADTNSLKISRSNSDDEEETSPEAAAYMSRRATREANAKTSPPREKREEKLEKRDLLSKAEDLAVASILGDIPQSSTDLSYMAKSRPTDAERVPEYRRATDEILGEEPDESSSEESELDIFMGEDEDDLDNDSGETPMVGMPPSSNWDRPTTPGFGTVGDFVWALRSTEEEQIPSLGAGLATISLQAQEVGDVQTPDTPQMADHESELQKDFLPLAGPSRWGPDIIIQSPPSSPTSKIPTAISDGRRDSEREARRLRIEEEREARRLYMLSREFSAELEEKLTFLEKITGYDFVDKVLALEALQALSSEPIEANYKGKIHRIPKNKRLAIFGDAILDSMLSEEWYHDKDLTPGDWSNKARAKLSNAALGELGVKLGLDHCLIVAGYRPPVDGAAGGYMVATGVEAVVGAVMMEAGWERTKGLLRNWELLDPKRRIRHRTDGSALSGTGRN